VPVRLNVEAEPPLLAYRDGSGRRAYGTSWCRRRRGGSGRDFTVTYAGFEGESVLLQELYKRSKVAPALG
jgi:hypothetical protein